MSYIRKFLEQGKDFYQNDIDRLIEENRKGDLAVTVTRDGKPVEADVEASLKRIDFDFGCNLFMVDQYDDPEQQKTYYEQWLKLFNTAVVPLYWEGTEPTRGELRYDADTPNDIYRRPPVDRVVAFCRQNGVTMKGHPLFWQEFTARWLPEDWDSLLPLLEKRMKEISSRYAGLMPVFDAVNEPSRLWDQRFEHAHDDYKCLQPPEGYIEQVFAMARKYFPDNTLILNEAVGASFGEFRGIYGGYYLLLEKLLNKGVSIDRIGLQCHVSDDKYYKNVFNAERLYGVMDGYGKLGKPLVLSEIGLSCEDEQLQAEAAEQLYKVCFAHPAMSGIFWWNLDDNSILCTKNREAMGENLPYGGLVRNGRPKAAYKVLDRLINTEWTTKARQKTDGGKMTFRGFYGKYDITVRADGAEKTMTVDFSKNAPGNIKIEL